MNENTIRGVYCILVTEPQTNGKTVSSEAYTTLEKAQAFCESRYKVEKVSEYLYKSPKYNYSIMALDLK